MLRIHRIIYALWLFVGPLYCANAYFHKNLLSNFASYQRFDEHGARRFVEIPCKFRQLIILSSSIKPNPPTTTTTTASNAPTSGNKRVYSFSKLESGNNRAEKTPTKNYGPDIDMKRMREQARFVHPQVS